MVLVDTSITLHFFFHCNRSHRFTKTSVTQEPLQSQFTQINRKNFVNENILNDFVVHGIPSTRNTRVSASRNGFLFSAACIFDFSDSVSQKNSHLV